MLGLEGLARRFAWIGAWKSGDNSDLIFRIWQLSAQLIFRCKKQPEQLGAANGDLLAKGQSANATERSACRIEPVWGSVMKSRALSRPPAARFIVERAARARDALQRHGAV